MVKYFGVFARLQRVLTTFVIPVCPSVHLELGFIWLDSHEI